MARKRESSAFSVLFASRMIRITYLMALALILAFLLPTHLSASRIYTTKEHIFPEFIKWHVYVVNGLSNNQDLFTHCKSTENDLGIHNIQSGSNITWSFRTDFTHSTLFWCYVRKDHDASSFDVFWYYHPLFEKCNWKNCIWVAKDDGIYLKDLSKNVDELMHGWYSGM
ncbi:hypothetical protein Lal_00022140 [Lupinus albus]|uniref:S-protein homolog n=1 Tax=Lupinus albus TaxID=3870 RepID=A0A6A4QF67_LUPAL|nr:putative plant self-incompatibility S1 [Lupinus albus]KAF1880013.1 hypothetical protein Lal_00022140 [Lupinus albus]